MSEQPRSAGPDYETRDVNLRVLYIALAALAALCVFAVILATGFFSALSDVEDERQEPLHPLAERGVPALGPVLQANPSRQMALYLREQTERTQSYAWLDPEAGVVRLPQERALELVLREGLPSSGGPGPEEDR